MSTKDEKLRHCSFCRRSEKEVLFLIPSTDGTYICDNCVHACEEMIAEQSRLMEEYEGKADEALTFETLPKPQEIKVRLDAHVIGQEAAKRVLSQSQRDTPEDAPVKMTTAHDVRSVREYGAISES